VNAAFDTFLRLDRAHARLRRKLDDELGTLHGLSLADFMLLDALSRTHGLTASQLERPLGVQPSAVVRQVIVLEKTGLVERHADAGRRTIVMRAPGRRLLREAAETAASICAAAFAGGTIDGASLEALAQSPALDLR
jgi:DNA-binding MarR family transcriptional regulator